MYIHTKILLVRILALIIFIAILFFSANYLAEKNKVIPSPTVLTTDLKDGNNSKLISQISETNTTTSKLPQEVKEVTKLQKIGWIIVIILFLIFISI